ncbi:MAG: alpha-mannosidase [Spirochaetota bacterium]
MNIRSQQQRTLFSHFTLERLRHHVEMAYEGIWETTVPCPVAVSPLCESQSSIGKAKELHFTPIAPGAVFAEAGWKTVWFTVELSEDATHLLWNANGESTVFFNDTPWCGLDTAHRWARIPTGAQTVYIRTSTYETGIWMREGEQQVAPPADGHYRFYSAYAAKRNSLQWSMYNDLSLLEEYLRRELEQLGKGSPEIGKHTLHDVLPVRLRTLLHAVDLAMDAYDTGNFTECAGKLSALVSAGSTLNGKLSLIGNSHLDLVWLWPERATREKNVHTCSTVLRLMEEYPDMVFTMSQPWLLEALKESSTDLYRQIKERIREGRWELTGGMYVEADTLLPCGEALARAFILGQEIFRQETGSLCSVLWLPDVFGYSQSIPQIASAAGVTSFYTTKLLWSSMNAFPYSSFVWQGLDGSELLCHVSQVGYESRASVQEITRSSETNRQAAVCDDAILAIGFGDGGGGVTDMQCERVARLEGFATLPEASWQRVDAYFERLAETRVHLPRYRGELYLEYHRGTYTTNHHMKQSYRRAEKALQVAEAAAVYRGERLDLTNTWKRLVFTQFHDSLPGSSIAHVYDQLIPELDSIAHSSRHTAYTLLCDVHRKSCPAFFNANSLGGSWLITADPQSQQELYNAMTDTDQPAEGTAEIPVQILADGRAAALVTMDGLSTMKAAFQQVPSDHVQKNSTQRLDNNRVSARFSRSGFLHELVIDGNPLEIASPATFHIAPDHPSNFDAWEIDRAAKNLESQAVTSMELTPTATGPLFNQLTAEAHLGKHSSLKVSYSIVKHLPYLFISVTVDWQEEHALLTYQVPTAYHGLYSRFGTPFGSIDRQTASGPLSKEAMWEVPASRWLAVTDSMHRGLAVLTEDIYGYAVTDGVLDISLLRSPCSSDEQGIEGKQIFAEKGVHTFEFALGRYQAESSASQQATAQAADTLFQPPLFVPGAKGRSPFHLQSPGSLTVSWVKPATTKDGYIIRLHETAGMSGRAEIQLSEADCCKASLVDLLEQPRKELTVTDNMISLNYSSYELLSVCVYFA